jgi:hypothetical protein
LNFFVDWKETLIAFSFLIVVIGMLFLSEGPGGFVMISQPVGFLLLSCSLGHMHFLLDGLLWSCLK